MNELLKIAQTRINSDNKNAIDFRTQGVQISMAFLKDF